MRSLFRVVVVSFAAVLVASTVGLAAHVKVVAHNGLYKGLSSDGLPVKVFVGPTLNPQTGTFSYCHAKLPFTISGARFSVQSTAVSATGKFHNNGTVTGVIQPSSCAGNVSTYKATEKVALR